MSLKVTPGKELHGEVGVPGDKSISHRAALLAALADGESCVDNFLVSGVTRAMLEALTALGIRWELQGTRLRVEGRGLGGWSSPAGAIHCGNSATTLRLLAGGLAASGVAAVLDGSDGLRRRPMERIVGPLQSMGVPVSAGPNGGAPLKLDFRPAEKRLKALDYRLPVASAQVKSCLLLAGLAAGGITRLTEPEPSRDHTERMLRGMGVAVEVSGEGETPGLSGAVTIALTPPAGAGGLTPLQQRIPGDFSAAAFLIVAALITPGSEILLPGVGINPTRTGLLDALRAMGARIELSGCREQNGEPVGDLKVQASQLHGTQVNGSLVVRMIDEFPAFAAAAAFANGETVVSGAEELRYKESDRISAICVELRKLGVEVTEASDGFSIHGSGRVPGGETVEAHGDHRLAMALALAGLAADKPVTVNGNEMMGESYPEFTSVLRQLGAQLTEDPG